MRTAGRVAVCAALFVVALPAAAEGGGDIGQLLLTPKIGTIFWTLVTFLFMAWILGKFGWKPLLGALDDRERSIRDSIDQAKRERDEANTLLAEHKELVAQARRERAEALAQGRQDAEQVKADLLDEARKQRDQMLKQTEDQVATAMRQARDELRTEAATLAIGAAEKLMARTMDDASHRRLVEDYLTDLERRGAASPPS